MSAKKRQLNYSEGTWFRVPLRDGRTAIGLVARMDGDGCCFGYFFCRSNTECDEIEYIRSLSTSDAVYRGQFGDLALIKGTWPVIGLDENWSRDRWPLPDFQRTDATLSVRVTYDDALNITHEVKSLPDEVGDLPDDVLSGYGAIELKLAKLIPVC